jgi:hypothetical protein
VVDVLVEAGLHVEALWPSESWLIFDSLANMPGPVSWPSRVLLTFASRIERALRRRHFHPRALRTGQWLRARSPSEYAGELLTIAGQVDFVARKPQTPSRSR